MNNFNVIEVRGEHTSSKISLTYEDISWKLEDFVESSNPIFAKDEDYIKRRKRLFQPSNETPEKYNGLMLDQHISTQVLGTMVGYFDSDADMAHASEKRQQHYEEGL